MLPGNVGICHGQSHLGAKLMAMGNNGNTVTDVWCTQANPAGISGLASPILALDYTKYLFAPDLSRQAVALAVPIRKNYLGFGFDRYGITEYNEIKAGFTIAKKFGKQLAIGIRGNYHQLKISNYGASTAFSLDVGVHYKLKEQLLFGLYITNPAQQKFSSKAISSNPPSTAYFGLSYLVSNKVLIATNLTKTLKVPLDLAIGIDYRLIELLSLRGGLTVKPFKQYAGFGLNYSKFMLDMAVESDPHLGYSPQITLGYAF